MAMTSQTNCLILEYLGGIETVFVFCNKCQLSSILEYLGGIETWSLLKQAKSGMLILEYLGGIET